MNLQLKGKIALVTGSSARLGEAIAALLAVEGTHVIVHGRNLERTKAVAKRIREAGGAQYAIGDLLIRGRSRCGGRSGIVRWCY